MWTLSSYKQRGILRTWSSKNNLSGKDCKVSLVQNKELEKTKGFSSSLNSFHANISMHILRTILCTFPEVLKENLFNSQEFL